MKYGYLFYRKPIPNLRKERPINLGDPIQSIAVINLYKEMGIPEEDIIPVERYDVSKYNGEEAIITLNGIEHYEHYAYHTSYLPPSEKLTPVYFSLSLDREFDDKIIENFKKNGPVGCRDEATVKLLVKQGCEAYLTGCVTMTFQKRKETEDQKSVFLIDCPASLDDYMPEEIKKEGIRLSSTYRINSVSVDNRITQEETEEFHKRAQERLDLLRDHARLVITSRFHAAVPAMAMGIPVILVHVAFDHRFQFLEKFLPFYTPDKFHEIDWNPVAVDIEEEKELIKSAFFSAVRFATARKKIEILKSKNTGEQYEWSTYKAVRKLPFPEEKRFNYAIWGVCLPAAQHVVWEMKKSFPNAILYASIDTYQSGSYMEKPVIHPDEMETLPEDTIIIVPAPSAHTVAKNKLEATGRKFVLLRGTNATCYNIS